MDVTHFNAVPFEHNLGSGEIAHKHISYSHSHDFCLVLLAVLSGYIRLSLHANNPEVSLPRTRGKQVKLNFFIIKVSVNST